MRVRLLLFGVLKDQLGSAERDLELPEGSRASDLLDWLRQQAGETVPIRSLAVAVNQEYARPETELREGDEVALLPPVSGGLPG
jgi:molybdopterin converting factor subunit 1